MNDCILILGAGGFVGRHLVRALLARGEKVIAVGRRPFGEDMTGAETVVGELTEPAQYARLLDRSRIVVHLASRSTPGSSAGKPVDELLGNLLPLTAMLQALQQAPHVNLLYLSSGGSLYSMHTTAAATELADAQPRSYHGAAKFAAERFISAWCCQYGGRATLLRPSNIYGPGQFERTGFGIVPTCFGKIIRGETLPVWGDGMVVRDYLYIDDFIALCLSAINAPMPIGALIFNAASGIGVSLNDLFRAIETTTGLPLQRTYAMNRALDAPRIIMDSGLARQHYDWSPTTALQDGLRKTWDWFNTTRH